MSAQLLSGKGFLKSVRGSQPFNWVATSTLKAVASAVGITPEILVKHLPKSGAVRSRLPNGRILRLWSRGDDWVANQVFWRGWAGYEPDLAPLFYQLASRANVTIDVGAHVGFYSILAALANPSGRVFAFEPLPPVFQRLQRNIELNRLSSVECIRRAAGETEGDAEIFFEPGDAIPSGSTLSTEIKRLIPRLRSQAIPVVTLDRFVAERNIERVDLVKIDVETTERQVLSGMKHTLKRDRPLVACEVWGGRGTENWGGPGPLIAELMAPLGYRCYALHEEGPRPYDGSDLVSNYLFTTTDLSSALSG
jgi:FkbM family methyltransferase